MKKNSRKAREKLAEALMALSTSSATAIFAAIIAGPLGALWISLHKGENFNLLDVVHRMSPATMAVFVMVYLAGVLAVLGARASATKIYNELYPDR